MIASSLLLVNQDKMELNKLSRYLGDSYHLFTARNRNGVMRTIESQPIHLIISDMELCDTNGRDLCAQLKSSPQYSHIPVILLMDQSSVQARIESLESGADACMERPFSGDYLRALLKNLIKNRASLKHAFSHIQAVPVGTMADLSETERFMEQLNGFIAQNLTKTDLNIDFLARAMNLSRPTLYRKVKCISDLTPNDLINVARLTRAAELISNSEHKIAEIAKMTGFYSRSNFGKAFLKHFKVTPSEYHRLKKEQTHIFYSKSIQSIAKKIQNIDVQSIAPLTTGSFLR